MDNQFLYRTTAVVSEERTFCIKISVWSTELGLQYIHVRRTLSAHAHLRIVELESREYSLETSGGVLVQVTLTIVRRNWLPWTPFRSPVKILSTPFIKWPYCMGWTSLLRLHLHVRLPPPAPPLLQAPCHNSPFLPNESCLALSQELIGSLQACEHAVI